MQVLTVHYVPGNRIKGLKSFERKVFFLLNFDLNLNIQVLSGEKMHRNLRINIAITYLSKNVAFIDKNHVSGVSET